MTGHPTPRRSAARPNLPPSRQRPHRRLLPIALLLALVLLAGAVLLLAGCGARTPLRLRRPLPHPRRPPRRPLTTATASRRHDTSSTVAQAAEGTFPVTVTDDAGNSVTIKAKPVRIVSTAPASTEILFALGAGDRVVGVTSLDDYPPQAAGIAKIGDFQANTEKIMALSPDLVVGYSVQRAGSGAGEAGRAPPWSSSSPPPWRASTRISPWSVRRRA